MAGVVGCGSSADARADIEDLVSQALTSKDPAACEHAMTSRYLSRYFGQGDSDPAEECQFERALPGDAFARQFDFRSAQVDGNHGIVVVTASGGQADGSVLRIELVRQGDDWKLDHLAEVQIDRPRFDAASRRYALAQGATAPEANCAVKRLHRFYDTDQLERAIVTGKTDEFSAAEVVCLGRGTLVKEFRLALRTAAPKEIPDPLVDCIGRRLTKSASTDLLRALFAAGDKLGGYIRRGTVAAAKACSKDAEAGLLPNPAAS